MLAPKKNNYVTRLKVGAQPLPHMHKHTGQRVRTQPHDIQQKEKVHIGPRNALGLGIATRYGYTRQGKLWGLRPKRELPGVQWLKVGDSDHLTRFTRVRNLPSTTGPSRKSLYDSEEGLTGSQIQRGAFMNSGSKDIGRDHDWSKETREWTGRRNEP